MSDLDADGEGDPGPVDDGGWDPDDDVDDEWDDDDDDEPVAGPTRASVVVPDYPADPAAVRTVLTTGAMEIRGRMPWSSNGTWFS